MRFLFFKCGTENKLMPTSSSVYPFPVSTYICISHFPCFLTPRSPRARSLLPLCPPLYPILLWSPWFLLVVSSPQLALNADARANNNIGLDCRCWAALSLQCLTSADSPCEKLFLTPSTPRPLSLLPSLWDAQSAMSSSHKTHEL